MSWVGFWGMVQGHTASLTRVFCSSVSLLKSSLAGIVYCIARPEEAIVVVVCLWLTWCRLDRKSVV